MKKILVTGATGFIGQSLVKELIKSGCKVRCLVRDENKASFLKKQGAQLVVGDVLDEALLVKAARGVETVCHLVGVGTITGSSPEEAIFCRKINVEGTRNILRACEKNKVKHLIYFSSMAAQGVIGEVRVDEETPSQASSVYEKSKLAAERLIGRFRKKVGFKISIIRPAMVYGPGGPRSELMSLIKLVKTGFCPLIGGGGNIIPLIYIDDLVVVTVRLVENSKAWGQTFIITRETEISFRELVRAISESLGRNCLLIPLPTGLVRLGAGILTNLLGLVGRSSPLTPARVDSITTSRLFNVSQAQTKLGLKSTDLKKSLVKTIQWAKKEGVL